MGVISILRTLFFLMTCIVLFSCSSGSKYKLRKDDRIVLDATSRSIKLGCTSQDLENSIGFIEVSIDEKTEEFIFRKAWPIDTCKHMMAEIQNILVNNKRVLVVGENRSSFKKDEVGHSWVFDRLYAGNDCWGYFKDTCKKPLFYNFDS